MQPTLALLPADTYGAWLPTAASHAAVAALAEASLPLVCLYGPVGAGKSHLLQQAAAHGMAVWDDLENLDNAGQQALFHALQRQKNTGQTEGQPENLRRIAVASRLPVAQLTSLLPDVKSRLLLGTQLELGLPTDPELHALLAHWAVARQLLVPGVVADYLLARAARNPAALKALLLRLDGLSLAEKRAITVPLARLVLEG